MNILGNDSPRIFCIILTHLYVAVDNQVALIGCRNTDRRIFRGCCDIQITVDNNIAFISSNAVYISPSIALIVCLINMQRAIAAICTYVVINCILSGSNTILIFYRKGMVLSLEIIGNNTVDFLYGITILTKHFTIFRNSTEKTFVIVSGINRCYKKARCTCSQKNTRNKGLPIFLTQFQDIFPLIKKLLEKQKQPLFLLTPLHGNSFRTTVYENLANCYSSIQSVIS